MNKSILVLEENSVIHGLVGSALELDGLTLHHEFNPENFVDRANSLMPDLILISNADQQSDYAVCRELRKGESLSSVPVILLANSSENIDPDKLKEIHVAGVVRKPFEASDLQQQVSRHLDLIDMIGSAYEYKKSQSIDDKPDPLADLQVVDSDLLDLLQDGAPEPAAAVEAPEVDFSITLEAEGPELVVEEQTLTDTLQPEAAFEPVASAEPPEAPAGDWAEGGMAEIAEEGEATLMEEARFPEADEPAFESSTFEGDQEIEELGPADLLEEETAGEAGPEPAGFDQSLEEGGTTLTPPLEDIEVEISADGVDFGALDEELGQDEVDLFEEGPGEEDSAEDGEDIPLSVRRMMELKPVFSTTVDGQEAGDSTFGDESAEEDEFVSLISSEGELDSLDGELGTLDTMELREESIFDEDEEPAPVAYEEAEALIGPEETAPEETALEEPVPEPAPAAAAEADAAGEQDEDDFREEYLGDDELDEDRILQAMQESEADEGKVDFDDFVPETIDTDEIAEMDELVALSEAELTEAPEEDGDEPQLVLDQDEEAIMLSALDEEAAIEGTYGEEIEEAAATAPPPMPEEGATFSADSGELKFDSEEEMAPGDVQAIETEVMDELEASVPEDQAPEELLALEVEAMDELDVLDESIAEIEELEADTAPETDLVDAMAQDGPAMSLEETEEAEGAPSIMPEEEPALEQHALEEEEPEPLAMDEAIELDLADSGELDEEAAGQDISEFLEDDVSELEEGPEIALDEAAATDAAAGDSVQDHTDEAMEEYSDFEQELMGLKAEIEANPEGEKLSYLLEQEGIKSSVDDLEFQLPDSETNLSRAMGVSELPAEAPAGLEAEAVVGAEEDTAPGGLAAVDLPGAMLDEDMKARLGEVLDEMITVSVRKAVQEEMPKLMEQLEKEDRQA